MARALPYPCSAQVVANVLPAQSGNFISFQGGSITHGGAQLANPLPVVILATAFERAYYSKDYRPVSLRLRLLQLREWR